MKNKNTYGRSCFGYLCLHRQLKAVNSRICPVIHSVAEIKYVCMLRLNSVLSTHSCLYAKHKLARKLNNTNYQLACDITYSISFYSTLSHTFVLLIQTNSAFCFWLY